MPKSKKIFVSGSLAYDRIMNFPDQFSKHILPDKIHNLNICFLINKIQESFGGTAGNIAYNLALLEEKPYVLGVVGEDFSKYQKWLTRYKINLSKIQEVKNQLTASAYIMTDKRDNQITAFYPGPVSKNYCQCIQKEKNIDLAIISPDDKERMLAYVQLYTQNKVKFIFDPGQQTPVFSAQEFRKIFQSAYIVIGNDYEIGLISKKLKINISKLKKLVKILITTKGAQGSEIYDNGKKIQIPAKRIKKIIDPTGAGDAYRAGLIKGILNNWDLDQAGKLASYIAASAVSYQGTQEHHFNYQKFLKKCLE